MSISSIQKRRVVNEILQKQFASGIKPTPAGIMKEVSSFFAEHQLGDPYEAIQAYAGDGQRSNVDAMNSSFDAILENLILMHLSSQEQIGKLLAFNEVAQARFNQIDDRREKLLSKIEDYLLSIYNSDGYFYSFSDRFSTVDYIDLDLSTAFVNTQLGEVGIPVNTNKSRFLEYNEVGIGNVKFYNDDTNEELTSFKSIGLGPDALFDGLDNTHWLYEVYSPTKITVRAEISMSIPPGINNVTKIALDPYAITESQYWVRTRSTNSTSDEQFGGKIIKTSKPFSFDDRVRNMENLTLYIRKEVSDYRDSDTNGNLSYRYLIGFRNITFSSWVYENSASMITVPISLPEHLFTEQTIDAVSLTAEDHSPNGSRIEYYVAYDNGSDDISGYDWRKISPLQERSAEPENVVRFEGSFRESKFIRRTPRSNTDLVLRPINTSGIDLKKRNPSQVIVPNVNVYNLTDFTDSFVPGTIQMEEGINTARVLVLPYSETMLDEGLSFWADYVKNIKEADDQFYKEIGLGGDFFYGGSIGTPNRSVYIETYVDAPTDYPEQIRDLVKNEANVKQWGIKLYLNGLEIADMPQGEDRKSVRYSFKKGLNHIAMTIAIPSNSIAYPNVYVGSIKLMNEGGLQNYGVVRLGTRKYVDFFDFKYNYVEDSDIFTIYDEDVLTFNPPTDNYRISYIRSTEAGPPAVRLRADFFRDQIHSEISPHLRSYRLRFAY